MAHFNEILAARYTRALSSLLRMQEQEGVRTLSSDLHAGIEIEGERPEYAYLKGERIGTMSGSPSVGAGVFSHFFVLNPLGSGILVVVTSAFLTTPTAGPFTFRGVLATAADLAPFGSGLQGVARDTRLGLSSTALAARRAMFTNAVIIGTTLDPITTAAANDIRAMQAMPVVLSPGFAYGILITTVNTAFSVVANLYERPLAPEETVV